MENSGVKKNFIGTIIMFCIWIGSCIVIVSLLTKMVAANIALGGRADVASIVGISLASTFGFGVAGLGMIFSIIGFNVCEKKPEVAKGFGIANFVFIMACLGTMVAGSIMITIGIAANVECSQDMSETPAWRANCAADIPLNIMIVVFMLVMIGVSVIGIISCVKIVSAINNAAPPARIISAPASSRQDIQPITATGSKGMFCSACGAPNESDAKFCKSCGKAC